MCRHSGEWNHCCSTEQPTPEAIFWDKSTEWNNIKTSSIRSPSTLITSSLWCSIACGVSCTGSSLSWWLKRPQRNCPRNCSHYDLRIFFLTKYLSWQHLIHDNVIWISGMSLWPMRIEDYYKFSQLPHYTCFSIIAWSFQCAFEQTDIWCSCCTMWEIDSKRPSLSDLLFEF